jgi:hypothetical protein
MSLYNFAKNFSSLCSIYNAYNTFSKSNLSGMRKKLLKKFSGWERKLPFKSRDGHVISGLYF